MVSVEDEETNAALARELAEEERKEQESPPKSGESNAPNRNNIRGGSSVSTEHEQMVDPCTRRQETSSPRIPTKRTVKTTQNSTGGTGTHSAGKLTKTEVDGEEDS